MHDFTVIVLQQAFASSVALTLDILASAAMMARHIGVPSPRWRLQSAEGGLVTLSNGLQIGTTRLSKQRGRSGSDTSTWIVPGLGTSSPASVIARLQQVDALIAAKAINAHVKRGGTVAASCSAVFLLHSAGVLERKTVTTSWWLASALRRALNSGAVAANRIVIADGNVVTAGAALAHSDLMLHLLRQRSGAALADAVSRVLLIDGRAAQAQYVIPSVLASGDALVAKLTAHIETALPQVPSVRALAELMCVSERTLARHVAAATGLPTLALVQHVRLARARVLLEKSRMPVEQVAALVGYSDATALRRLMKKAMGATPRQLRMTMQKVP
jgi:transcriptional regulator GlxA family with amidase domain